MTNNIYFIANWKMYGSTSDLTSLNKIIKLKKQKKFNKAEIIYFPPFTLLHNFINKFKKSKISVGGQNCHHIQGYGSFTGSVSAKMLRDLGCKYVILGHSENRTSDDSDEIINKSRSLKGVMNPFSTKGNYDLLERAGFKDVMTIQKYICFGNAHCCTGFASSSLIALCASYYQCNHGVLLPNPLIDSEKHFLTCKRFGNT